MKTSILFLLLAGIILCGCQSGGDMPDAGNVYAPCADAAACDDCDAAPQLRYSMPHGNDLVLETAHHIIQIDAQPGVKYDYYVWTGDRPYSADPDLVVQDGVAAVLVEE